MKKFDIIKLLKAAIITGFCSIVATPVHAGFTIGHKDTELSTIPDTWITSVKSNLHIAYNHTSHGSQLITGLNALEAFPSFSSYYSWTDNSNGSVGELSLDDRGIPGIADLSQGDVDSGLDDEFGNDLDVWAVDTFNFLTADTDNNGVYDNAHVNVIMWSWCNIGGHNIPRYLNSMEWLIRQFGEGGSHERAALHPVQFVFMTAHANGGGEGDSSDSANNQIRAHCATYDRILFDFSDIENYDPDNNYFLDKLLTDALQYDSNNDNVRDAYWSTEYLARHFNSELYQLTKGTNDYAGCSSCAHSDGPDNDSRLNCVLKGRAAWNLFAHLAGWEGDNCTEAATELAGVVDYTDPANIQVNLSWNDISDTNNSYTVQSRISGTTDWTDLVVGLPGDAISFTDADVSAGSYDYRVLAHIDESLNQQSCDSPSSIINIEVDSVAVPAAPSELSTFVSGYSIQLNWQDNSNNESGFELQRKITGADWLIVSATIPVDSQTYFDENLAPGEYSYRLRAYNRFNMFSDFVTSSSVTVLDVPAAPSSLRTKVSDSTVYLHWLDNSNNETSFVIMRNDGSGWVDNYDSVGQNITGFIDSLLPDGTYGYQVYARNPDGDSSVSNTASAVVAHVAPLAPSDLISTFNGSDLTLTWTDNSDNEDHFVVERSIDGGLFTVVDADVAANPENSQSSWLDSSLAVSHVFTYRVKAVNSFGESPWSNEVDQVVAVAEGTIELSRRAAGGEGWPDEIIDSFLSSTSPDSNSGSTQYVSNFERYIFKFNLPELLDGKLIVSAALNFYLWSVDSDSVGQTAALYKVDESWEENVVTWNSARTCTCGGLVEWLVPGAVDTAVADFAADITIENVDHDFLSQDIDITSLVQQWVDGEEQNNGLVLVADNLNFGIKASEYYMSNYPLPATRHTYLKIEYSSESSCIADYNHDNDVDGHDIALWIPVISDNCLSELAASLGN